MIAQGPKQAVSLQTFPILIFVSTMRKQLAKGKTTCFSMDVPSNHEGRGLSASEQPNERADVS